MGTSKPAYVTREAVKSALDVKQTARSDAQVDRAIAAASRAVEARLRRRFYPETGTRYFDWPSPSPRSRTPWRLWLSVNELISITSLSSGGITLPSSDYFLRRSDDRDEPPYDHIQLDISTSAVFETGDTHQRNIAITGVFGYSADEEATGSLAQALDDSETEVDVTDSSLIGVGDLIRVGTERMIVTGKTMLDTGVTASALTDRNNDVSITLSTGTGAPVPGEVVLIGSERMLVVDRAGLVLTVKRAWDGSVLASHASGASIWAPRTLTVSRAVLGTTAASHDSGTAVLRHVPPALVTELALAYALNNLLQSQSGYARTAGEGENKREFTGRGIRALEKDAFRAHGRIRLAGV